MSQASAYEQFLLELINAERAKVGVQPLAFDGDINEAAELHSRWMINTDTFSHTGQNGSNFTARMTSAGYSLTGAWRAGENIAWASLRGAPGYQDEVQLLHTNLMSSPSHKANLLNVEFREAGLGFEVGEYRGWQGAFITEDFAKSGTAAFLTGVAFDDKDGDRFYDPGEGLAGLKVTATGSSGSKVATTEAAGGYDMTLGAGTYTVTFSGPGIATTSKQVTIGSLNVKLDLVDPAGGAGTPPPPNPPPPPPSNTITGTQGNDTLQGTSAGETINGLGGADHLFGHGGGDTISGGSGHDYLYGGLGVDALTGGAGYDGFVFNVAPSNGIDRITDFSTAFDTIWLQDSVYTAFSVTGTLPSAAFHVGTASHDTTDRIIYNPSSGAVLYDPDGNGAAAAVQFALLGTGLGVTARDFNIY